MELQLSPEFEKWLKKTLNTYSESMIINRFEAQTKLLKTCECCGPDEYKDVIEICIQCGRSKP